MTYIAELKPGDWIDVLRMNEVDPFEDRYWVKTVRRDGPRGIRYGLTKSPNNASVYSGYIDHADLYDTNIVTVYRKEPEVHLDEDLFQI